MTASGGAFGDQARSLEAIRALIEDLPERLAGAMERDPYLSVAAPAGVQSAGLTFASPAGAQQGLDLLSAGSESSPGNNETVDGRQSRDDTRLFQALDGLTQTLQQWRGAASSPSPAPSDGSSSAGSPFTIIAPDGSPEIAEPSGTGPLELRQPAQPGPSQAVPQNAQQSGPTPTLFSSPADAIETDAEGASFHASPTPQDLQPAASLWGTAANPGDARSPGNEPRMPNLPPTALFDGDPFSESTGLPGRADRDDVRASGGTGGDSELLTAITGLAEKMDGLKSELSAVRDALKSSKGSDSKADRAASLMPRTDPAVTDTPGVRSGSKSHSQGDISAMIEISRKLGNVLGTK